jgi:hypothetical protein
MKFWRVDWLKRAANVLEINLKPHLFLYAPGKSGDLFVDVDEECIATPASHLLNCTTRYVIEMHRCSSACPETVGTDVGRADALPVKSEMSNSCLEGSCDATYP